MRHRQMLKEAIRATWYRICQTACRLFCAVFFPMRVHGLENIPKRGPFLLAGNHQSYMDPVFCGVRLRRRLSYLARESLFENWFFAWLISSLDAIPLRRDEADLAAVKKVVAKLKQGKGVCLFPEGTRTRDGKIAPFKAGLGLLCRRGEAPIVPVMIDGAFECWPRHKRMFSRGPVTICFGTPVTAEQACRMGDEKLVELLTDTLRKMQNDCRIKNGKEPYDYYPLGDVENADPNTGSQNL